MARTLLVSHPRWTWREWLKSESGGRDVLCLDPSDADHGPPGRVYLLREGKARAWRFIGATDLLRNPVGVVGAAMALAREASDDAIALLFAPRSSPILRQAAVEIAQALKPEEVLVPQGSALEAEGWPVGAWPVEVAEAFPAMVLEAQRRARWIELIEQCAEHRVQLSNVTLSGARLGSAPPITAENRAKMGLDWALHAEVAGGVLLAISKEEVSDDALARALDLTHASRGSVVNPSAYEGLLCSFARQDGEDFGMGVVRCIDFAAGVATVLCTAVAPAPVRILRLGMLKVDEQGKEAGSVRPWTV